MIAIDNILDVEKYIDEIETVVFDLDDTLYPEREYVESGFLAVENSYGMPGLADELIEVFEQDEMAIDIVLDKHEMLHEKEKTLQIYRNHCPVIHLYEGVREMLIRLHEMGKKLGIITDGRSEGQRAKIEVLKLDELFDKIIITDELGGIEYRKPNPLAFEKLSEIMGVPYASMCYVGDNTEKDFIAPQALGMRTIWFNNQSSIRNLRINYCK